MWIDLYCQLIIYCTNIYGIHSPFPSFQIKRYYIILHDINKDIIETQDVPFIVYTTADTSEPQVLKLRRPYTIIWEFFIKYCNEAVKTSNKK